MGVVWMRGFSVVTLFDQSLAPTRPTAGSPGFSILNMSSGCDLVRGPLKR